MTGGRSLGGAIRRHRDIAAQAQGCIPIADIRRAAEGSDVAAWEAPRGWPSVRIYIGVAKTGWDSTGVNTVLGVAICPPSDMLAIA